MRVAYLCLQATREGQASHAHVHEIIDGLRQRHWTVDLYEPDHARVQSPIEGGQKIKEFVRVQRALAARIRKRQYEVIYIRLHPFSFLTSWVARRHQVPVVAELNGLPDDVYIAYPDLRYLRPVIDSLLHYGLRTARAVIAVTPALAEWVRTRIGISQVILIPNGANVKLFRPVKESLPQNVRTPYALFFGALAPWQGVEVMLDAVHRPEWPAPVSLVIAGEGVERARVVKAATRTDCIVYLGTVAYAKMPALITQSLCGLVPKSHQVHQLSGLMPLKLFETLACGVPAIVTDYPGMADLVRHGDCGIVIPPNDPAALAKAVRYLYEQPQLREEMGRRGRELIVREHSWDARAEATHQVLLQVLAK